MVNTVLPLHIFLSNVTILNHLPFNFFLIYFILKDPQMLIVYIVFWDHFFPGFAV